MKYFILLLFSIAFSASVEAQLLKKLKEKVNQAVDKTVDKKASDAAGVPPANGAGQPNNTSGGKPTNTKEGGLSNSTPPDVNQQIADAEKSHGQGNYSDARYSIQQALVGIEIQLGRQILASLPASINGMTKDTGNL